MTEMNEVNYCSFEDQFKAVFKKTFFDSNPANKIFQRVENVKNPF